MSEIPYSNREIDEKFKAVHERFDAQDNTLGRIEKQTTLHNGRMTRMERTLLIVGTAVAVLLITNGSQLVSFVMGII